MTAQFVDISSFQGSIAWASYRAWSASFDGISRIAMKATEGTGFVDPLFVANRAAALSAGIDEIYYYHFGRPDLNGAVAEANFMHSTVGNVRNSDLLILDYEQNVSQATAEWAYEWLAQQEANYGGKLPGIYASPAYIAQHLQDSRLAKYPLWQAQWTYNSDSRPQAASPWTSYKWLQYSDKANIQGISNIVDANIFLGSEEVTPMANTPTTIDITTPGVSTYFKASADDKLWTCTNGYLIGGAILDFYKSFGGSGLCGLTHLGMPLTSEIGVAGHPGVTVQEFERGGLRYDPSHQLDSPPGAGSVYLIHTDQDPRTVALQSQITALKTLPGAANLQAINALVAQASTAIAQAGTAIAKIGPLSQVQ